MEKRGVNQVENSRMKGMENYERRQNGEMCKKREKLQIKNNTEYTECLAFSPVVRIGSPSSRLTRTRVLPPLLVPRVGDTLTCRESQREGRGERQWRERRNTAMRQGESRW
jgi:hypothetical protein